MIPFNADFTKCNVQLYAYGVFSSYFPLKRKLFNIYLFFVMTKFGKVIFNHYPTIWIFLKCFNVVKVQRLVSEENTVKIL